MVIHGGKKVFCSKCGQEIKDDVQFCPKCGANVGPAVRSISSEADDSPAEEGLAGDISSDDMSPEADAEREGKKQKKKAVASVSGVSKLIGMFANLSTVYRVVCLAILVVVGVTLYGFFGRFFRKDNSKKVTFSAQASLEKVLKINELHTVEYVYNSYAVAYEKPFYDMDVYDQLKPLYNWYLFWKPDLDAGTLDFANLNAYARAFVDLCDGYESADAFLNGTRENDAITLQNMGYGSKKEFFDAFVNSDFNNLKMTLIGYKAIADMCYSADDLKSLINFLASDRGAAESTSYWKTLYAVAYEGKVIAGINKEISFSVDDDNQKITVHVPPVCIVDLNVNLGDSNSVITRNRSVTNQSDWVKNALQLCRAELKKKLDGNDEFLSVARENALDAVKALIRPFEQVSEYTFEIVED